MLSLLGAMSANEKNWSFIRRLYNEKLERYEFSPIPFKWCIPKNKNEALETLLKKYSDCLNVNTFIDD
jgi:hypothetical protein